MKKARKKRRAWQIFLWGLRHPVLWNRMIAIQELRRKRLQREYTECMCKGYDPEFERWWRKEQRKPIRMQFGPTVKYVKRSNPC